MNELYGYSYLDVVRGMPPFAWEVFNAFDAGEYHHSGDTPDSDPEELYTKPRIREVLGQDVVAQFNR
jgi:hypothetical protein